MYIIRVQMANGIDEYRPTSIKEAMRIIHTAVGLGKKVIALKHGKRVFDNVNV